MKDEFRVVFHTSVPHAAGRVVWSPDGHWVVVGAGISGAQPGLTALDAKLGTIRWQVTELFSVTAGDGV